MDLITTGTLTLGPTRATFNPPPAAGFSALILRCLAEQYHTEAVPSLLFRSATGQVLATLVRQENRRARGAALLQAGVDALRACWLIDHSAGEARVSVTVRGLRAGGQWYDLTGIPLSDADLAFLPTLHAAAALREQYPALTEDRPTGWYGLTLALTRSRFRPPIPRHPRVILAAEGELASHGAAPPVPPHHLVPTVLRLSHPDDPLWEIAYAADLPLDDQPRPAEAVALRSVTLLTARPRAGGDDASWCLHWQAVQGVDAFGHPQGPLHVYHVEQEPEDLPSASEFERVWTAIALAERVWPCTHRTSLDWPAAHVPLYLRQEQQVVA